MTKLPHLHNKIAIERFASRTNWSLAPNRLALRRDAMLKEGIKILDLTESNPTRCHFKYLNEKLLAPLTDSKNLRYAPSPKGLPEARTAISDYYRKKSVSVNPEHIFLTASTSEAYASIFRLLAHVGDRVLVPQPSYPLFNFLADLNDVLLGHYRLRYDQKWNIDRTSLTESCHPETKAVVVVHPNNPTGSFVKRQDFARLVELCRNCSVAIVSDEVFSDYSFFRDLERIESLAECKEVLTFALGGISKALGLPQMKLAWMVVNGPKEVLRNALERLEVILDTFLSVSAPAQRALPFWFSLQSTIQMEILERLKENHSFLLGRLRSSHPCTCLHVEGGWSVILRLPRIKSEEEWALEFLEKDQVAVYPGYFFDFEEKAYIVISLLVEPETFQEALTRLLDRVEAMKYKQPGNN